MGSDLLAPRSTDRWRLLLAAVLLLWSGADAAPAQNSREPFELVTAIYRGYQNDNNPPGPAIQYSDRLQALLDADARKTPLGYAGRIDWDVFVNGNNFEVSNVRITPMSQSATRAQMRADFENFKKEQQILIDLVREGGVWRIDEVRSIRKGARWTMSKILRGAPDAFPDQQK